MVYCGKASQGCQSCRTRRIKCDKKEPECSQCIRVGKRCPGYRDQLSLMFRDESSKVIQKAHAQWGGTPGSPTDSEQGTSALSEGSPVSASSASPSSSSSSSLSGLRHASPAARSPPAGMPQSQELASKIPRKVELNLDQRGLKFYMERYLFNHPDAPTTPELIDLYFGNVSAMQNVMIAVGLAGMSNLLGNKSMNLVARSKYVTALKQTGQLITNASLNPTSIEKPLRSIVALALFELVQGKGSKDTAGSAITHIHGAIALLRSVLPVANVPGGGARAAIQLMFSMFIPAQMTATPLPTGFYECLKICKQLLEHNPEACVVDLAFTIARLLHLLLYSEQHTIFIDRRPETADLIQRFLELESVFDRAEKSLQASYPFVEQQEPLADPQKGPLGAALTSALFRGKWHAYSDIWGARIWNHFRWASLLFGESVINLALKYPLSSARLFPPPRKVRCYATIERIAEDMLISTPSHWHHPSLDDATAKKYEAPGQGGAGAAGLPTLLWHLKVAGCAPNVPPDVWEWSYNVLQVVWKSMGMQHALSVAEAMEDHRRKESSKSVTNESLKANLLTYLLLERERQY
ncbi:hypothetical protein F5Y17DRAFT_466779 [Xylariaceae sp. FL0594]|nr:hypothetical protein F5Y17DRAFT_466779 [Xylariaceae sp. FL0594]